METETVAARASVSNAALVIAFNHYKSPSLACSFLKITGDV